MNIGTALLILADVIKLLKGMMIIDDTGKFRAPTAAEDSIIASRVVAILENYGVDTPDQVEKILTILPVILSLAGIK